MSGTYELGMIGLGTMGRNLLLNMADHGFSVAGLDLDQTKVDTLRADAVDRDVKGTTSMEEFIGMLRNPKAILMLVPAGAPVDAVIASLRPYLTSEDVVIDSGNSYYKDTDRRLADLATSGIRFVGAGISGGEEGARHGASIMVGGTDEAYARIAPVLTTVAAKADDGKPCLAHVGPGSAGHYVKMVHNGIEYALMQLIAENYDLMKRGFGLTNARIADVFESYNNGMAGGFLFEITSKVLRFIDPISDNSLVDLILDAAKMKGTGKWTSQDAMDLRSPVPSIDAAVSARDLSGLKSERLQASLALMPERPATGRWDSEIENAVGNALLSSIVLSYAQGFAQLRSASTAYGYNINLAKVAAVWRAGCIIRSKLLEPFRVAFAASQQLSSVLIDPTVGGYVSDNDSDLRRVAWIAMQHKIPMPVTFAGVAYWDGYRSATLPANLIQAQRDLFGAHTYERIDRPGSFHTDWNR